MTYRNILAKSVPPPKPSTYSDMTLIKSAIMRDPLVLDTYAYYCATFPSIHTYVFKMLQSISRTFISISITKKIF